RFLHAMPGEPLLEHYGVPVRCLVAIPLLIIAEATLHEVEHLIFPRFLSNGLVNDATRPAFDQILQKIRRQHDATTPWLLFLAVALAVTFADRAINHADEMSWAVDATGALGFGGVWFAYIVRPLFLGLLFGWLWRLALTFVV